MKSLAMLALLISNFSLAQPICYQFNSAGDRIQRSTNCSGGGGTGSRKSGGKGTSQDSAIVKALALGVAPNPTTGKTVFTVTNSEEDIISNLVVYDLLGEIVISRTLSSCSPCNEELVFSVPGIYLAVLYSGKKSVSKKIVVE